MFETCSFIRADVPHELILNDLTDNSGTCLSVEITAKFSCFEAGEEKFN